MTISDEEYFAICEKLGYFKEIIAGLERRVGNLEKHFWYPDKTMPVRIGSGIIRPGESTASAVERGHV